MSSSRAKTTPSLDADTKGLSGLSGPPDRARRAFAAVVVVVPLGVLLVAQADTFARGLSRLRIHTWLEGQYNFTYEHEFVRRGLPGEILRLVRFPEGSLALFNLSVVMYLVLAAVVAWLAWTGFRRVGLRHRVLLCAGVLALPYALPHFAYDLGRTDTLFYIVSLWLLLRRSPPPALVFAIVGLAAVLMHELFIVVCIPFVTQQLVRTYGARKVQWRLVALVASSGIAALLVIVAGDLSSVPQPEFAQELARRVPEYDKYGGQVHRVLYTGTDDAISYTSDRWSPSTAVGTLAAAVPGALTAWWFARARPDRSVMQAMAISTVPMLTLFVLGADAPRWVALMSFTVLLVGLLELRRDPLTHEELARPGWLTVALAATILLGPIGVVDGYPMWGEILEATPLS